MSRKKSEPSDAALPAAVSDAAVVELQIPELSSEEWAEHRTTIEARIVAAEGRLGQAKEQLELGEIGLLLGKLNAEQLVTDFREEVRLAEIEVESLKAVLVRADTEKQKAVGRETLEERERRIAMAKMHVSTRVALAAKLDAALKVAGAAAAELDTNARVLAGFADVTKVTIHSMNSLSAFTDALFASAPALAKVLHIERDKAMPRMKTLAENERAHWRLFCPVEIPADANGEVKAAPGADPLLGQFGARAIDTIRAGNTVFKPGEVIQAEVLLKWPLKNRLALVSSGKLEVFASREAADGVLEPLVMGDKQE